MSGEASEYTLSSSIPIPSPSPQQGISAISRRQSRPTTPANGEESIQAWKSSYKKAAVFQFDREGTTLGVSPNEYYESGISTGRRRSRSGSYLSVSTERRSHMNRNRNDSMGSLLSPNRLSVSVSPGHGRREEAALQSPPRPESVPLIGSSQVASTLFRYQSLQEAVTSRVDTPDLPRRSPVVVEGADEGETSPLLEKDADDVSLEESKSSFSQTLFNSINILMGIGLLSLPFAFKLTGWAIGIFCMILFSIITRHTALLLARSLDFNPADQCQAAPDEVSFVPVAYTYGDIGELAFGSAGRTFISIVFLFELFAACVALVILTGDSLVALFPTLDLNLVKCVMVAVVLPLTVPRSLNFVSYGSLMGIIALVNLLFIIVVNGLSTKEVPGSLIQPADTVVFPDSWSGVPMAFGLIMAGFAGHSVFPNLYRDMAEPVHYEKMVNWTYFATTFVYFGIAAAGYRMFGSSTMGEISQNLPRVSSYNPILTQITVWLVAINPITKYPLAVSPLTSQFEISLNYFLPSAYSNSIITLFSRIVCVSVTSLIILVVAIIFPGFHNMMGLLGSFFSFTVSVLFPEVCYLKLYGRNLSWKIWVRECTIIFIGLFFGTLGTVWAFLFSEDS